MDQRSFALLGLSFVLVAAAGVLAMLELWGNEKTRFNKTALKWTHRICGYLFITIYVVMMYSMLKRIAVQTEPLTPLQTVHVALALMLLPLLTVKILILRRFKGLSEKLPYLGLSIFTVAFTLNAMTAGFYFVRASGKPYVSLQFFDRSRLSSDVGRGLLEQRCQKCHALERIFTAVKTEDEWTKTVNTMMLRDPAIKEDEAAQIIFYLSTGRAVKPSPQAMLLVGMNLTDTKCGRCHMLERLYHERRTAEQWTTLVDRMVGIEPAWISVEDAKTIKEYLIHFHGKAEERKTSAGLKESKRDLSVTREITPPEPNLTAEEIFQTRCSECHTHDRIYAKSRDIGADKQKWQIVLEKMRKNGAPLTDTEIPKMIEYLAALTAPQEVAAKK